MSESTHLVFELGFAHRDAADRALRLLDPVDDTAFACYVSGVEEDAECSIGFALAGLARGSLKAVQWTGARHGVRWIEMRGPHDQGVVRAPWLLSFEYDRPDWERTFDQLVHAGCLFGVVSIEESLDDLVTLPVEGDALPWDDWRLVLGYVPSRGGEGPVRRFGPGFDRIKSISG